MTIREEVLIMASTLLKLLKSSSIPVWILSFYIFIWYLQIGNRFGLLGQIRIEFILGAVLIVLSLVYTNKNTNLRSPDLHTPFIRSIYFFYCFIILYTVFSYDSERSQSVFFDRVFKFSMLTLFIGALVRTKAELILVLLGFLLAMGKIIQEGVLGVVTGGMVWENQGIPRLHGVTLLYRHPNSLSGLAVSALPFFLLLFRFQSFYLKLAFLGAIAGLLVIVMYTGSRTGYVATLFLFLILTARVGLFKAKTILLLFAVFFIALPVIPTASKDRFGTMFKSNEERGRSANKRMEIITDAFEIAAKYPFGVGVQAFPHVREVEFGRKQDTHNLYLEILTNLGPLGFIAFWVFVISLIRTNRKSQKILLEKRQFFIAEVCYIINLYIMCRLVLGLFGMDLYEVYWWFAAGFTSALAKLAITSEQLPAIEPKSER